jgi:uncharacterized protein YgiM (DUF1202 family)
MQSRRLVPFLVLLFVMLVGGRAHADVVALKQDASLRAEPGEKAKVVAELKEGQKVRVLERKDRWVKVQVKGKTGWVTRTQIDDDQRGEAEKEKEADGKDERKGKEEGWGTVGAGDGDAKGGETVAKKGGKVRVGDEVTFGRKAPIFERANEKSDVLFTAKKGEKMTVVSLDEDGWIRVQTDDGDKGWCKTSDVGGGGGGGGAVAADDKKRQAEEDKRRREEQAAEDKRRRE